MAKGEKPATKATKKASPRGRSAKPSGEEAVAAVIAEMPDEDRTIAERLHAVIVASAPELSPKLWYGQPAYAKGGNVVCFFRGAKADGERYLTLGFSGVANLDDGNMWPTAYAVTALTSTDEERIGALVEQAAT